MGHRAAAVSAPDRLGQRRAGTRNSGCRWSACAITIVGLEYLYRRTLVGRAFLAIAEDNFAARALGLPERNLRVASYALAGVIGGVAGFSGGELLLAFFANGALLNFYGFVPVALGGLGNNRGAVIGGLALGLFQQAANFLVGGIFSSVAVFALFIVVLLARAARPVRRLHGAEGVMTAVTATSCRAARAAPGAAMRLQLAPFLAILAVAMILPFVSNDYWALIGTRAAIYWVLVSGLNLVVGFAGHLAIGYVALLTLGAYTTSVLVAGNVMPPLPVFAALPIAGCVGAVFGVIVGLPALRLRTFYFAMSTLGFATIVTQIALAWQSVTGGGIGIAGSGISRAVRYRLGLLLSLHRRLRRSAPG